MPTTPGSESKSSKCPNQTPEIRARHFRAARAPGAAVPEIYTQRSEHAYDGPPKRSKASARRVVPAEIRSRLRSNAAAFGTFSACRTTVQDSDPSSGTPTVAQGAKLLIARSHLVYLAGGEPVLPSSLQPPASACLQHPKSTQNVGPDVAQARPCKRVKCNGETTVSRAQVNDLISIMESMLFARHCRSLRLPLAPLHLRCKGV